MPDSFQYNARTVDGDIRTGIIQAESKNRVAAILAEQLLIPTEIKPVRKSLTGGLFSFMTAQRYKNLILFTRNLSTLYKAGIPILRALSIIKIGKKDGAFNVAVREIRDKVKSGTSIASAMADYPRLFPKYYIAAVSAGEHSGKLDKILDHLGVMLEKDLSLNRQIKSSIRYPLIIVGAIAAAFVVLFTFVIPRFMEFYAKMNAELPLATRSLIWINNAFTNYWYVVLAVVAAGFFIFRAIYTTPSGKLYFDDKFLSVPIFGDLMVKGNIARFSYIFQILTISGVPIVRALEMLGNVVKNAKLTEEIEIMGSSFREGGELLTLEKRLKYFPDMALQMVKIGLESGSLDSMLGEIAGHYSREVDYRSRQLTAILEPILTIVLGIFVLIVALAIFLPMWNLIQIFRG